ncbi:MAG: SRPBCC family protein, partial [Chlorobium sp.]|nr:SRPBCC family protein [Chlorobium sp.]
MLVQHTVIIRKPLAAVESYLTDISNNCKWQEDVSESGVLTDGDIGIGTKGYEVRNIMNFSVRTEWEVTAYQQGSSFSFTSTSSVAPYEGTFDLETVEGG